MTVTAGQIIIRHLRGSKTGQIETFVLAETSDILLGRGEDAAVRFDPEKDDLVSRRHARISRDPNNHSRFILTDLDSSNGTYINASKDRLTDPIELPAGSVIELGPGGPQLQFDLDPRPGSADGPRATRILPPGSLPPIPSSFKREPATKRQSLDQTHKMTMRRPLVLGSTIAALFTLILLSSFFGSHDRGMSPLATSSVWQPVADRSTDAKLPGGRRVALIIGNSRYRNISPLDNPGQDAQLIAETVTRLGFELVEGRALLDLDRPHLEIAVQAFTRALQNANSKDTGSNRTGTIALFYYSGHGIQERGTNYLVPIDANPTKVADFDFQMMDVNVVLHQLEEAGTALNLVILDACRNNPFGSRNLRAPTGGLAEMRAPEGTLIVFATQSGNVAQDGPSGGNSPFAQALAWGLQLPDLDQFGTFNAVAVQVKKSTGGSQQPWMSNSPIEGRFFFVPPSP